MSVSRNTIYNLLGTLIPIAVGLITVPAYLHLIGEERYGVLAIVWLFLGYFGFFDLGLSRATANFIAKMQDDLPAKRQDVFWTALGLNATFGAIGGCVMYFVAPLLMGHLLKMPDALRGEVLLALPWIAIAIPLTTISGVFIGSLEGRERFPNVNTIQVVGSILIQILPLLCAYIIEPGLGLLIPATIIARAATLPPLVIAVVKALPLGVNIRFDRKLVKPLLGYGGWVATTFLIIPILETIDKFIIGAVLGARAVTYYTIPFSLVDRLRIIPRAFMRSLFPVFSRTSRQEADELAVKSIGILAALLTPLTVSGMFLIEPFLTLWVGKDLSLHSATLGQILLVGIWMNSLSHIAFALLDGSGRPDILTKMHLLMLPFFLGLLWIGAHWFGIEGVAVAWSVRVWLDAIILIGIAGLWKRSWPTIWPGALLVLTSVAVAKYYPTALAPALALTMVSMGWSWLSEPKLRHVISTSSLRIMKIVSPNMR